MDSILIILNLVLLESLLSVDNAAVLAIMVRHLPKEQQPKALRYGLLGAFLFRGISLFCISWLISMTWIKFAGGAFLLFLAYKHFVRPQQDAGIKTKKTSFWQTVVLIEIADLSFSIDNVFAAVAMTDKIWLILTGVFIGIIAMRFIAGWFVKLLERNPSLSTSAYIVIALLGLKLIMSAAGTPLIKVVLESHTFEFIFSGLMVMIFSAPLLFLQKK